MKRKTYTKKRLDLTIKLGAGTFGESLADTVTLTGLRMQAEILKPTGDTMGVMQLRVFGIEQSMMNRLTVIGLINQVKPKNTVLLAAGDENGMTTVFEGVIWEASADYNAAPDVALNIMATVGLDLSIKPAEASSYKGAANVASIMADLAKEAGLTLEDSGVDGVLSNPYFSGTTLAKIRSCAKAANINYHIDGGVLSIWPRGAARTIGGTPLIAPETGMVGYPSFSSKGMALRSIFNPAVSLGANVQVQSSIDMASGTFTVFNLSHSLSSEMPDGPWFTNIECFPHAEQ